MKVLALVDGEHYPPVTRWALETAEQAGMTVVAALLAGGAEKLGRDRALDLGSVRLIRRRGRPRGRPRRRPGRGASDAVLDLSDEPVIGPALRMELAARTLARGVAYVGPDFRLDPPSPSRRCPLPTIAVIGSGKRVAKTAVGGHLARLARSLGHHPVVVAMGRGGPAEPQVAGPDDVTVEALLARARRGEHAASDFLEDALVAGVTTVGARRAGGGLAGRPFVTNVAAAAALAVRLGGDPVILEGSGSAVPRSRGTPGSSSPRPRTRDWTGTWAPSRIAIRPRGLYHGCGSKRAREPFRSRLPPSPAPSGRSSGSRRAPSGAAGERERQGCVLRYDCKPRACRTTRRNNSNAMRGAAW